MKLQKQNRTVETSGVEASTSFSIKMDGKAFRILSSNIYENKIGSIVREISSNCLDAHIQAKTPERPFVIHVPDSLEPYISFQDFGVGLSPQQISEVYTQLFNSTKENSNEQVGAFGLGSKTPFAYDDRFSISSIYDGVRTEYAAYLDETGIPKCDTMMTVKTTERNGVTITINVKEGDFYRFRNEIQQQLRYFAVKPILTNADGLKFEPLETPALSFDGIDLLNNSSMTVIQGGVGYRVDYRQLSDKINQAYDSQLRFLYRAGCRLYFDIGSINVTASREGIEYDDHTIKSIEDKLKAFKTHAKKHLKNVIKSTKNDWELGCLLNDSPILTSLMQEVEIDLKKTSLVRSGREYRINLSSVFVSQTTQVVDGQKITKDSKDFRLMRYVKHGDSAPRVDSNASTGSLVPSANISAIYVKDTAFKPLMRLKKHVLDNELSELFVVTTGNDNYDTPSEAFDDATIKRIAKVLQGAVKVGRLSELETPEANNNAFKSPIPTCYLSNGSTWVSSWNKLTDSSKVETGLFLTVDRLSPTNDNGSQKDVEAFENLKRKGLIDDDVKLYAFNVKNTESLSDDWVKLSDFIAEQREQLEPHLELFNKHELIKEAHSILHHAFDSDLNKVIMSDYFISTTTGDINIFARALKAIKYKIHRQERAINAGAYASAYNLRSIFNHYDISDVCNQKINAVRELTKDLSNKYKLLKQIRMYSSDVETLKEHIVGYVNCMSEKA